MIHVCSRPQLVWYTQTTAHKQASMSIVRQTNLVTLLVSRLEQVVTIMFYQLTSRSIWRHPSVPKTLSLHSPTHTVYGHTHINTGMQISTPRYYSKNCWSIAHQCFPYVKSLQEKLVCLMIPFCPFGGAHCTAYPSKERCLEVGGEGVEVDLYRSVELYADTESPIADGRRRRGLWLVV